MSVYWHHNDDLSTPPRLEDLKFRPENVKHRWESTSGSKAEALKNFWVRWERETGKKIPADWVRPYHPKDLTGFSGCREQLSRRPSSYHEKREQDANS